MAHIIRCFIILALLCGSFAGAAQAAPCPHMMAKAHAEATAMKADMPCHEDMAQAQSQPQKQDQQPKKHCNGMCLCGSLVTAAALLFPHSVPAAYEVTGHKYLPSLSEVLVSRATAPPLRPPKILS
ncbi:MAG: CopL family metal-binding regulatory protein [Pseudobdellovibrionaceae bacterium]